MTPVSNEPPARMAVLRFGPRGALRKPRGQTTVLVGCGNNAFVLQPQLGDSKEDIEGHVATEFFFSRTDEKRSEPCFQWLGVDFAVQNNTGDFDFTIHRGGRRVGYVELVELVERPPGARGSPYSTVSTKHLAQERADHVYEVIKKKWDKYRAVNEPIFLVMYATEEGFMPSTASTRLVTHWLFTRPDAPSFAAVFLRSVIPAMPNQLLFTPSGRAAYLAWAASHGLAAETSDEVVWNLKLTDFRRG